MSYHKIYFVFHVDVFSFTATKTNGFMRKTYGHLLKWRSMRLLYIITVYILIQRGMLHSMCTHQFSQNHTWLLNIIINAVFESKQSIGNRCYCLIPNVIISNTFKRFATGPIFDRHYLTLNMPHSTSDTHQIEIW